VESEQISVMNGARMKRLLVVFAAVGILAAGAAHAIDDNFDPAKYDKGGFAPVTNAQYTAECGSCHFAYLPGMLPARSWHALIAAADKHFGESLSLRPEVAKALEAYLTANAADHTDFRGSKIMLYRLEDDRTPTRITALPLMRQRHVVVTKLMAGPIPKSPVKTLTNCEACHERAATGSFAYNEILIPGVTKVVPPNSVF
jgi:hypothetical protein